MSLLTSVERAIKSCKAEQARINESIQLYRGILQYLTPPTVTEEHHLLDGAEAAVKDTNASPGEKEDIELLERALEKALQVRTTSTSSGNKNPERHKQPRPQDGPDGSVSTSKKNTTIPKGSQQTRSTVKSTGLGKRGEGNDAAVRGGRCSTVGSRLPGGRNVGQMKKKSSTVRIGPQQAAKKKQQAGPRSGSLGTVSASHPQKKTSQSTVFRWEDSSPDPSNTPEPSSHTDETGTLTHSPPQGGAYEQITKWKSLRSKENRLWEKVIEAQSNTVPGRDHFLRRMRATFAKDVTCGITDEATGQVNKPTHSGHDVGHHGHMTERQVKSTLRAAAAAVESEMEAWDRWRPGEGRPCHSGPSIGAVSTLPLTVTYTTEGELRELERRRMQVVLLRQEINLEQALFQALSPHLSSVSPASGSPNPSVLRDMYSLLGEGGERSPAVVLDTEPE